MDGNGVRDQRADRLLRYTAILFIFGWALHSFDHYRVGQELTPRPVFWAGQIGLVTAVGVVVLVFRKHPLAPLMAVAYGFVPAVVYAAVHFPPYWGPFSEPYRSGVEPFSWFVVFFAIGTALIFGFAGLYAMRAERRAGRPAIPLRTAHEEAS